MIIDFMKFVVIVLACFCFFLLSDYLAKKFKASDLALRVISGSRSKMPHQKESATSKKIQPKKAKV